MSTTEGKSDRELLALAAKAVALEIEFPITRSGEPYPCRKSDMLPWNPLTDDGDALRLAVKLRLIIRTPSADTDIALITNYSHVILGQAEGDVCESTRRAIVRAAAELGSRK